MPKFTRRKGAAPIAMKPRPIKAKLARKLATASAKAYKRLSPVETPQEAKQYRKSAKAADQLKVKGGKAMWNPKRLRTQPGTKATGTAAIRNTDLTRIGHRVGVQGKRVNEATKRAWAPIAAGKYKTTTPHAEKAARVKARK